MSLSDPKPPVVEKSPSPIGQKEEISVPTYGEPEKPSESNVLP